VGIDDQSALDFSLFVGEARESAAAFARLLPKARDPYATSPRLSARPPLDRLVGSREDLRDLSPTLTTAGTFSVQD